MEVFVFVLGLIVGSFLNVLVLRHNTGRSTAGRSGCFSCGKQLKWFELVPLFSFAVQKGRCRGCKSRISWQYPLVELATGVSFFLVWLKTAPSTLATLVGWLAAALLIAITAYDLRHKIIPNAFVLTFNSLGLVFALWHLGAGNAEYLIAGALGWAFFAFLWLVSGGRAMGFGDATLTLGMGFFLGLSGVAAAIVLAFWVGALTALLLLLVRRKGITMKSEIPFAPFLALGCALAWYYGLGVEEILAWFSYAYLYPSLP